MATKEFPLEPQNVAPVNTDYRCIQTQIPVPESLETLKKLRDLEPRSMGGQPPVVWDGGDGFTVRDAYGNRWLDFSAGVLVTASGHGIPDICDAIRNMADQQLYHAYCFPTEIRAKLIEEMVSWLPAPLKRVFLLTTGSEATECCMKIAKTAGAKISPEKNIIVSFENGFHGRTMGAQLAGGSPGLKSWVGGDYPNFVQVPFPDGFRQKDVSFDVFTARLAALGVDPNRVCAVISETYQGCNACLMPAEYAQALRKWCDEHQACLIFDEVQAGFGRTGKPFGFMHFGVVPDLVACGKGISGGMPCSAVLGTEELMNLYGPGEMTSTHSANPVCSAAALANLKNIRENGLVDNAAALESVLLEECQAAMAESNGKIGKVDVTGLVGALQFTAPGTTDPDPESAWQVVLKAVQQGVMLFAPVGVGGCCIKICPPLCITEAALREGMSVIRQIIREL